MNRRRLGFAVAIAASGCAFDSAGVGSSGATIQSDPSASDGDATGDASATETHDAASSPTTTAPIDDTGSEGPTGGAMLVLDGAPAFDFADIELGEVQTHGFVLRNEGGAAATGLGATVDALPFSLSGGAYPGQGGTCTDTLAAQDSCILVLACAPTEWGPMSATLALAYDDPNGGQGSITSMLTARGVGRTENLLENGNAEQGGKPPSGWAQYDGGGADWQTVGDNPFEGTLSIWAGEGSDLTNFRLRQSVVTDTWYDLVQAGELQFLLSASTRAFAQDNDPHEVRMRFFDGDNQLLDEQISPEYAGAAWNAIELEGFAPTGTRYVQVQLRCTRKSGDNCDAFFDAVVLVAVYE